MIRMAPMSALPSGSPGGSARPPERRCDPLAATLGNASLLGVGYLLLGRRGLAIGDWLGTAVLVGLLAAVDQPGWVLVVLLLWWIGVTAHVWYLARGVEHPDSVGRQRLIAVGVLLAVLPAVGASHLDSRRIETEAAEAHANGECSRALSILDGCGPVTGWPIQGWAHARALVREPASCCSGRNGRQRMTGCWRPEC